MARICLILLLLAAWIAVVSASSAPTFCKCTCFKNSTIIPLGPEHQKEDSRAETTNIEQDNLEQWLSPPLIPESKANPPQDQEQLKARSASSSCSSCTKAFCLSQGIDFCKDAKEEDVFTMCFQRDSNKDKIMVWGFIIGTVGLLGWAGFKRAKEWQDQRSRGTINYSAVGR